MSILSIIRLLPILSLLPYTTIFRSSVFTRNTSRGEQIARRIEAGATTVNDAMINYAALELPMGGAKASGLGSRDRKSTRLNSSHGSRSYAVFFLKKKAEGYY